MRITSPAFENGGEMPSIYTCDGDNKRPTLSFSDIPDTAKSLVIIMDDPDSPTGTWNHWTAWNINPTRTGIEQGEIGEWVEGTTSFGSVGYGGPCPHMGKHRYFFKLYALDTTLELKPGASKEELVGEIDGHIIAESELMGTYERS